MTHDHSAEHQHRPRDAARDAARLNAWWPFVAANLPPAPAATLEIGCGPLGGFVPAMIEAGYDAVGVDPEAPGDGPYARTTFEQYPMNRSTDAVVACTSLHHVAELESVADRILRILRPGGTLIVLEWAWERFDEATARWCLERLPPASDDDAVWLQHHRQDWEASGLTWDAYLRSWAASEGLHPGSAQLDALASRFDTISLAVGPYFFADLEGVDEQAERAAIDSRLIQPNGIRYVAKAPGFQNTAQRA